MPSPPSRQEIGQATGPMGPFAMVLLPHEVKLVQLTLQALCCCSHVKVRFHPLRLPLCRSKGEQLAGDDRCWQEVGNERDSVCCVIGRCTKAGKRAYSPPQLSCSSHNPSLCCWSLPSSSEQQILVVEPCQVVFFSYSHMTQRRIYS